ncbi:hypothetical protein LINPERHAP2_LOCUS5768 [Linum perenne]
MGNRSLLLMNFLNFLPDEAYQSCPHSYSHLSQSLTPTEPPVLLLPPPLLQLLHSSSFTQFLFRPLLVSIHLYSDSSFHVLRVNGRLTRVGGKIKEERESLAKGQGYIMAMQWSSTLWMIRMVWLALAGWMSSCFTVADEIAHSIRTGDIGPFVIA